MTPIEDANGTSITLQIPKGNILLINNGQKVYLSQILAEIKKDANLILEEDSKHVYTQVSGETFFQNVYFFFLPPPTTMSNNFYQDGPPMGKSIYVFFGY